MSTPFPPLRTWDHAESLVVQWEQQSRLDQRPAAFYRQLCEGLAAFAAAPVQIFVITGGVRTCLATSADQMDPDWQTSELPVMEGYTPMARWAHDNSSGCAALQAFQRVQGHEHLLIQLTWATAAPNSLDQVHSLTLADVSKAAVEICCAVYIRDRIANLELDHQRLAAQVDLTSSMHGGVTLQDSLHAVAKAWAHETRAQVVSLLKVERGKAMLVCTNHTREVDVKSRRSHQLVSVAEARVMAGQDLSFAIGPEADRVAQPTQEWLSSSIEPLLRELALESGTRQVDVKLVSHQDNPSSALAVVVCQWDTGSRQDASTAFLGLQQRAISLAFNRQAAAWRSLWQQLPRVLTKSAVVSLALMAGILAILFLPVRFRLPVDGHVTPVEHRRLYAPASGLVASILCKDGDAVTAGQALFQLQSNDLDRKETELQGNLAAAKVRYAAMTAARSANASRDLIKSDLAAATNEETLATEIKGLEQQLALVKRHQAELLIKSPLTGKLHRWDLQSSLTMRPVTQGQYLADIHATQGPWRVELRLPDRYLSYLPPLDQGVVTVSLRLQVRPEHTFTTRIARVAPAAELDALGNSFVQLECPFADAQTAGLAIGATVWGEVDCGNRALGFVWFRGVLEWFQRQTWL